MLKKFSPFTESSRIQQFRDRFYKKYENEEILLLKVLDDDFGLGYPHLEEKLFVPLLKGINFTGKPVQKKIYWTQKDSLLSQKLSSFFLDKDAHHIEITDEDLDFPDNENDLALPTTFSAMIEVYKSSKENIYISGISANAANLMGRFSYFNENIKNAMDDIIQTESLDKDTLFAEIVHLPESREGNVILRPQLTEYEIPILSKSLLPLEKQIHLNDLFLRIENNRFILKSKKLNRKIIPRLSSSHFYAHPKNLSLYKFLADLQYQDTMRNIYFDWGIMGKEFPFLPRVVYKDIILSKAYWNVSEKDIRFLTGSKEKEVAAKNLSDWRIKNRIPDTVVIKEMDNKLYIDFNNDLLVELFFDTIKNKKSLQLEEFLYNKENVFIHNTGEQFFVGELIINYYKK